MRTTDGGANWVDVSPPSIPSRTPKNDEFFLDATHAWVAETASSSKECVAEVVTFRTADGGVTWQQAAPIPVRYAIASHVIWTGTGNHASLLDFTDAQTGWLLIGSGAETVTGDGYWNAVKWSVGDLYRTTDGGLHWTLAASNPGSATGCVPGQTNPTLNKAAMSFSSPTTGWIILDCGRLIVTRDGGSTWRIQVMPAIPLEVPHFFDAMHGMALAQDARLLVTSDGGSSWSIRPLPGGAWDVDFTNPREGWAVGTGDGSFQCGLNDLVACNRNFRLYHTSDGGKTWVPGSFTSLAMPAPKYWPPAYLHFVDSKNGFVTTGESLAENGLFRTTDAGRTWTRSDGTVQGP